MKKRYLVSNVVIGLAPDKATSVRKKPVNIDLVRYKPGTDA